MHVPTTAIPPSPSGAVLVAGPQAARLWLELFRFARSGLSVTTWDVTARYLEPRGATSGGQPARAASPRSRSSSRGRSTSRSCSRQVAGALALVLAAPCVLLKPSTDWPVDGAGGRPHHPRGPRTGGGGGGEEDGEGAGRAEAGAGPDPAKGTCGGGGTGAGAGFGHLRHLRLRRSQQALWRQRSRRHGMAGMRRPNSVYRGHTSPRSRGATILSKTARGTQGACC